MERKTPISTYFCSQPHKELRSPECPKSVSAKRAETQVWGKLYEFAMNPDFLHAQAKDLVKQLQQKYEHLQKDRQQILEELEKEFVKRQQVITEARKALRDDPDFAEQMRELYKVEERLKHRLATLEQEIEIYARLDWEEKVKDYVVDLQAGIEGLNKANPKTPDENLSLVHHFIVGKRSMAKRDHLGCIGKSPLYITIRARHPLRLWLRSWKSSKNAK